MITNNNFNYFITYNVHVVFLHWTRGGFVTISTNLSTIPWCPLQQNNILLNIASMIPLPLPRVATQLHIPYWSILIDNSFYCSTNHFIVDLNIFFLLMNYILHFVHNTI